MLTKFGDRDKKEVDTTVAFNKYGLWIVLLLRVSVARNCKGRNVALDIAITFTMQSNEHKNNKLKYFS